MGAPAEFASALRRVAANAAANTAGDEADNSDETKHMQLETLQMHNGQAKIQNGINNSLQANAEHQKFPQRRQEPRARGEAFSGHLAQPLRSVRCQLGRRVWSVDVPRGGRGEHGAALASLGQIDRSISPALVPGGGVCPDKR